MCCLQTSDKHWDEKSFSDWKEALVFIRKLLNSEDRWIFRGVSDYCYDLTSSLDRAFDAVKKFGIPKSSEERWKHETNMLYQFKRRAHHYLGADHTPRPEDFLEWFSLMRHYGAPSRLVDFSNSFYIATYFAVSAATKNDAAIYCVNHDWLNNHVRGLVKGDKFFQDPEVFRKYAMPHPSKSLGRDPIQRKPFVVPVRPFRSNERIHVQQGLFLCPTDVNATFIDNLKAVCPDLKEVEKNIMKIQIPRKWHKDVMHDLRKMNISSESLYPGLEGFAASIKDLLYFKLPLVDGRLNEAIKKNPLF